MSPAVQIQVERGLSFSDAVNLLNTEIYPGEGFYISKKVCMNTALLKYSYTCTHDKLHDFEWLG